MELPDENLVANEIDKAIQQAQKLRKISNPKISEKGVRRSKEIEKKEEKKCKQVETMKIVKKQHGQTDFIAANKNSVRVASLKNKKVNRSGQDQEQVLVKIFISFFPNFLVFKIILNF